ncbi:hypothetical protein [Streptomyces phaeoluteigriseus]
MCGVDLDAVEAGLLGTAARDSEPGPDLLGGMAVGRPKRLLCRPRETPMSVGPQTTPGMSEATCRPGG